MAFLSRSLSDTFDEAKFRHAGLLQCMGHFPPVHHSTKGKVNTAMEILSILAPSAKLLGCLFAPRCYIITLPRPDKNTL